MLKTRPVDEVIEIIADQYGKVRMGSEIVPLECALSRVLSENIVASAYIPAFDRSTVDGYAVIIDDLVGCSKSLPAKLKRIGQTRMGMHTDVRLSKGQCVYVPTGGEVPSGTEAMVMIEDTVEMGDGTIGFCKSYLRKMNMIFRGEDMQPGTLVIPAGKRLKIADTGTLAAMGIVNVPVMKKPLVGIISTGDELVPASEPLMQVGMIRDVNAPMLQHAIQASGGESRRYGIVKDDQQTIRALIQTAIAECDLLLISGGTSMDVKDMLTAIIGDLGEVIVHGITLKPGKPTIFGSIQGKPVFGVPGNPVSAYFTFYLFIRPLLHSFQGTQVVDRKVILPLSRRVITNHGREEYVPVILKDDYAQPVASKSGLITTVSCADGFIRIARDCNEVKKGELVEVTFLDQ
ncbi:MAG: gephyrin-like molybdotransferase Glp [Anaerolineaceae bacterium]